MSPGRDFSDVSKVAVEDGPIAESTERSEIEMQDVWHKLTSDKMTRQGYEDVPKKEIGYHLIKSIQI